MPRLSAAGYLKAVTADRGVSHLGVGRKVRPTQPIASVSLGDQLFYLCLETLLPEPAALHPTRWPPFPASSGPAKLGHICRSIQVPAWPECMHEAAGGNAGCGRLTDAAAGPGPSAARRVSSPGLSHP